MRFFSHPFKVRNPAILIRQTLTTYLPVDLPDVKVSTQVFDDSRGR